MPLESALLFSFRTGKAGLGDDHVCVYSSPSSSPSLSSKEKAGTYAYNPPRTILRGVANNPYVHGLDFRRGRLHATWVYRGFVHYEGWDDPRDVQHKRQAGPNSGENNYDICYAYADVQSPSSAGGGGAEALGVWYNGAGEVVAGLGEEGVRPDAGGITAFAIPKGSGLANQEAQAVDGRGGVHVLNRDNLDGEMRWKHYYRSPEG